MPRHWREIALPRLEAAVYTGPVECICGAPSGVPGTLGGVPGVQGGALWAFGGASMGGVQGPLAGSPGLGQGPPLAGVPRSLGRCPRAFGIPGWCPLGSKAAVDRQRPCFHSCCCSFEDQSNRKQHTQKLNRRVRNERHRILHIPCLWVL